MRHVRGFTLLEVLLAVTIAVMLTATLAGTISIGFRVKKEAEFAVESVHGIETAGDVWVTEVKAALPPNTNSSADPNAITTGSTGSTSTTGAVSGGVTTGIPLFLMGAFYGDAQTLQFYNTGPASTTNLQTDIKYVEFGLTPQNGGTSAFVRRTNTSILSQDSQSNMRSNLEEEVLVTNVTSLSFRYYDENNNVTDTWDSTNPNTLNSLPYSVEMILTLASYGGKGEDRVIHRYAMVTCAQPVPVDTTGTTGGVTNTPGLGF